MVKTESSNLNSSVELSIILPTYNEARNIQKVIEELESFFSRKKMRFEIIVVDDSSPDQTARVVEKMQRNFENIVLLKDQPKEGIGKALERGYDLAKGDWLFSMDADRAFRTNEIDRLLAEREKGADLVVGSKYLESSVYHKDSVLTWLKSKISEYGNRYISVISRVPLRDFSMNFRLLKKEVWKNIHPEDKENFFLVEMLVQAHRKGYRISEVGVSLLPRDYGTSKTRVWKQMGKFLAKTMGFVWTTKSKPVNTQSMVRRITACRVCGNEGLLEILSLGDQAVSDFVDLPVQSALRAPLELVLCDPQKGGCGLLQLRHTVSAGSMYEQYWYRSGINQTMQDALAEVTLEAQKKVFLENGDMVLDIGCNDGTLLRQYEANGILRVGFDPAKNLMKLAREGTTRVINDFFSARTFFQEFPNKKAKVVTSIAMFYDLDNPSQFVADVQKVLDKEGIWIIQMNYLPIMLQDNVFDNICHEHLEYYSLSSLEALLSRHHLKAVDVQTNTINGGSFRIFIRQDSFHSNKDANGEKRVSAMRTNEKKLRLDKTETYLAFAKRVEELKKACTTFIFKEAKKGKRILAYGASTKGNVMLQYYGLDSRMIEAASDRNPMKHGKKMVGGQVPIISEEEARLRKPDYFLVLPWFFLKEFVLREQEFLQKGGKFIVPLPKFEIIDKNNWKKIQ